MQGRNFQVTAPLGHQGQIEAGALAGLAIDIAGTTAAVLLHDIEIPGQGRQIRPVGAGPLGLEANPERLTLGQGLLGQIDLHVSQTDPTGAE